MAQRRAIWDMRAQRNTQKKRDKARKRTQKKRDRAQRCTI